MRVRVLFDQTVYQNCEDKSYWVCGNASEESYLDPKLPRYETITGEIHRQLEINFVTQDELVQLQQLLDADLIVELFVSETDSELPLNDDGKSFNQFIAEGDYVRPDVF